MSHTKAAFRQYRKAIVTVVDGVTQLDGDFNVLHYVDAATCIQAAIDSIKTVGGRIYIRAGNYNVGTALNFIGATKHITVFGDDDATVLNQSANIVPFDLNTVSNIEIRDLYLALGNYTQQGISLANTSRCTIDHVHIEDPVGASVTRAGLIHLGGSAANLNYRATIKNCLLVSRYGHSTMIYSLKWHYKLCIKDNILCGYSVGGGDPTGAYAEYGIYITDGGDNTVHSSALSIRNNRIYVNPNGVVGGAGIQIHGNYEETQIRGNQIIVTNSGNLVAHGIYLSYGAYNAASITAKDILTNNTVTVTGAGVNAGSVTVYLQGQSITHSRNHVVFSNNILHCHAAPLSVGVSIDSLAYFTMEGNSLYGGDYYIQNTKYATVGVNFADVQQTAFADQTTGFNVQEQIVKAWGNITNAAGINDSYNVTSASRPATGQFHITFSRDFRNTNYVVVANPQYSGTLCIGAICTAVGACDIYIHAADGSAQNAGSMFVACGSSAD
jgi:hypothetical protein